MNEEESIAHVIQYATFATRFQECRLSFDVSIGTTDIIRGIEWPE